MQQMKEYGKNSQNQTDEEEIDSIPVKEFRVMIVKMIKNFENKMNAELNRLEAQNNNMQKNIEWECRGNKE